MTFGLLLMVGIAAIIALTLWTAPTPSERQFPSGTHLDDGFRTLIVFASDPNVAFWEKTVQPPGMDGGDPVETSTMHNVLWRTMSPRFLRTATTAKAKVAYDPKLYVDIVTLINKRDTLTVRFPNHDMVAFYGYLKSFTPDALEEGKQPEADVEIQPTNEDPTTLNEEAPVWVEASGTGTYD